MTESSGEEEIPEPVRVPEAKLSDLEATVRRLSSRSDDQARALDHLRSAPTAAAMPSFAAPPAAAEPVSILAMEGEQYETELDALQDWVDDLLLPVFGREVTSSAPWCQQWPAHREAVARLHSLWLAFQQHMDPDSGPAGMAVWIRDFLDHTWAQLRAPNGPFAACTTNPETPQHRILPGPKPTNAPAATGSEPGSEAGAAEPTA